MISKHTVIYARRHAFGPVQGFEVAIAVAGRPIKPVYLYRVGSLLIDTGPYHLRNRVQAMLGGGKLETILLTHHHEDHSGNAALLQQQFNAPVYLHSYGVEKLSRGFRILPYQHLLFGRAPQLEAKVCPETLECEELRLRAIHTPGHSKDHTVYFAEKEGWLFSGDLWVGERIQFFRVDERIEQQIESLRKIAELDFDTLFCGHNPSATNGSALIRRKLDYLVTFQQQVSDLHRQGVSEREIITRLRKKNDLPVKLFTMGNASFSHMVRSSLSTLPEQSEGS